MYFKVKAKSKPKFGYESELKGLAFILTAFLLSYCLVIPQQSGALGQAAARILFLFFGKAAFVIPLIMLWWGYSFLRASLDIQWRINFVLSLIFLGVLSSLLSLLGQRFYAVNSGGFLGLKMAPFFYRIFGPNFALVITTVILVYLGSLIFRVSLRDVFVTACNKLVEDYKLWQKERAQWKKALPPKIKTREEAQKPQAAKPEPEAKPKIIEPQKPVITKTEEKRAEKKPADAETAKKSKANTEEKQPAYNKYQLPLFSLLSSSGDIVVKHDQSEHLANAELLTKTLEQFNISAKVKEIIPGPVVTRYDIELAPGIKIQAVTALSDNISLSMKVPAVRIIAVPEKSAVGIEVPNSETRIVNLKGIFESQEFANSKSLLTLALGRTTDGASYVTDLVPMPHLLIAGATGSGKSVGIHSIIASILYKARPDEVKFLLIDPKRLELPMYHGIPHIYDPSVAPEQADIITQPKEAALSLKKLVKVMEKRYEKFAKETVRNIEGYNEKMQETGGEKEFYIVVVIDELADLMLIATKEVEDSIQRLAQMARAVGIHLILATQRPSVDVITGVIKANFPARIAFQTTSKVDSRVILDTIGAEDLFGKGDMLFVPPGESKQIRLQGGFISQKEIEKVVKFIKDQNLPAHYEDIFEKSGASEVLDEEEEKHSEDLSRALQLVRERKRVSQDLLKAHFGSSARATNILSLLETKGFIHKPEGTNRWQIHFDKIDEYLNLTGN
ncbi:MAG: DNA translocase FtsK [Elusimicrobia bacterium]|nr:DNA translocase FtsK [Candidatus Liberimonas magnetica]